MERKTRSRLLIGGLIVFSALIAIYTYWVFLKSDDPTQDWQAFLLNVSTELIGALIVFFFFNLFFFLDDWDLSERVAKLLNKLERERPKAEKFFRKMPEIGPMIQEADAIDLCGVSLTSTINRHFTLLRDSLAEGTPVRLLIVDPRSTAVEMANTRSETQDIEYYKKRLEASFSDIGHLWEKWEGFNEAGSRGSFQVRLMPYAPSFGLYIFHRAKSKGLVNVEIYPHHSGYGAPPIFTLDEGEDSNWYEYFKNQFEEMWQKSIDWNPALTTTEKRDDVLPLSTSKAKDFLFENNPDLTPYFRDASDIRLFGIDLKSTLRNHLNSLSRSLEKENSSLRVIITSEHIFSAKQKESIETLKWLIANPKNKGTIQVREFQEKINYAFYATDPLLTKGRIQIRIYTPFWKHANQPKFEIFQERDLYWMEYFLNQFDQMWDQSKPILSSIEQDKVNLNYSD